MQQELQFPASDFKEERPFDVGASLAGSEASG